MRFNISSSTHSAAYLVSRCSYVVSRTIVPSIAFRRIYLMYFDTIIDVNSCSLICSFATHLHYLLTVARTYSPDTLIMFVVNKLLHAMGVSNYWLGIRWTERSCSALHRFNILHRLLRTRCGLSSTSRCSPCRKWNSARRCRLSICWIRSMECVSSSRTSFVYLTFTN